MKRASRLISLLLILCLLAGMLPAAFAANGNFPFTDIREKDWFANAAVYVYENGLMSGTGDGKFSPNQTTTRGMIVTILHRMEGMPAAEGQTFTDVEAEAWYGPAVAWASANGIVGGYGGGLFGPNDPITREQLAAILYRFAQYKKMDTTPSADLSKFADSEQVSDWAEEAMAWAVGLGLISGMDGNLLVPGGNATRAQSAMILARFCGADLEEEAEQKPVSKPEKPSVPETPEQPEVPEEPETPEEPEEPGDGSSHTVTFVRNDGTAGAHSMDVISDGSRVVRPADPTWVKHGFTGWYTDPACAEAYDFSEPVKSDLVLYAGWNAPDGETEQDGAYGASEGGGTIYSITGIKLDENRENVTVTVNSNDTSILVVQFLDDDGDANEELVCAPVSVQTPEYCEGVEITLPVNAQLPATFQIRVMLVDKEKAESGDLQILAQFTSIKYTAAHQEFDSRSIYDEAFEGKTVLNFDEDIYNNYGVLSEGVKEVEPENGNDIITVNRTISDEPGSVEVTETYLIDNPSAEMQALQPGDKLLSEDADGNPILLKVGTVRKFGNTLVITPAQGASMSDFYETLKLDMTLDVDDAKPAEESDVQMAAEIIDVDKTWSKALGGSFDFDPEDLGLPVPDIHLTGELMGTGEVEIEMTYDAKLFAKDYFYCSIVSDLELTLEFTLETSIDNEEKVDRDLEFLKVHIPTGVPGLTVYFAPSAPLEWEFSGGGFFNFTSESRSGFVYDTKNGYQKVDEKDRSLKVGLFGEAEASFGPRVALGVAYLGDVVTAEIGVQAGVEAEARAEMAFESTDASCKHGCVLCLAGECNWFIQADAELEFCIIKDVLDAKPIDEIIIKVSEPLKFGDFEGEFYVSVINDSDSIFKGEMTFGNGECPNVKWRTVIQAQEEDGTIVGGCASEVLKQNGQRVDSGSTPHTVYLMDGVYQAKAKVGGKNVTKSFVVNGEPTVVTLTPSSANGKLDGKITDADSKSPISGAQVLIYDGRLVVATCISDANGNYQASLPDGTYRIQITKIGYVPFEIYETVREKQTTYLETAMMVYGNRQLMGGFSGTITDATTGAPVEDVILRVYKGWNNSGEGEVVATIRTDRNGQYHTKMDNIFGVVVGLNCGNYTVYASKNGYITGKFNATALPGVSNPNQNGTISPVIEDEEGVTDGIRVILTWGMEPNDLDSHFNALQESDGKRLHIFYANRECEASNLDVDDTDGQGPETITITNFDLLKNGFTYSVHDYSNHYTENAKDSTAMSNSGAIVRVYQGNTLLRSYPIPTNKAGTVWNVFSIDANGNLKDLNTFTHCDDSYKVGYEFAPSDDVFGSDYEGGYDVPENDNVNTAGLMGEAPMKYKKY